MRKETISVLLIFTIISLGISCRGGRHRADNSSQEISQELQPQGKGRGQQKRRAVGQGFGKRSPNRNAGRVWGPDDVVELSEEEITAIQVETVKASVKPLRSQLQALGKVFAHPRRKAIVSYAFSARVSEIHIQLGDWAKIGQKLVTLQSEEVGSAKSEFYKAQADYELAKVNYERQKRLFDRGVGAQKDYLSSEAEYKVAGANLNAAEKKLHVMGFSEEQVKSISETHQISPVITLYAPISGKIIEHNAILGAMVDQETEILTIMDPSVVCIHADIYERDIAKIRIGQGVEATVPAYPGETFEGKISFISDVLNEETRTITVRSEVRNRDYKLKPGMFADINIFLNHQSDALVIPLEAVLDEGDDQIVFLKIDGKFIPRIIKIGIRNKGFVEVLAGIEEGAEVVTVGNFQLKSKLYDEILKKAGIH
ncbi:MAG: efflux RND transporter periplasmic adaptor subunit [Candidatus Aminicenantes bacterium]|nr:MAG: efflux RND transporter periplasmic adaptor subunit [Candidatus Aminicenantes bacterium]